jgi:excisionase family DNA binding protein
MLEQIRGSDAARNDPRVKGRESREDLLQRLLDPLLTLEETAKLLGVCPTTVRRYTNKGQLKHLRTQGNQRRFRFSEVMEFLESRAAEVEADREAEVRQG